MTSTNTIDAIMQSQFPTLMVPIIGSIPAMENNGHRFLMANNGVWVHPSVDHGPQIARFFHLPIAIIELVQQCLTGNLEVTEVVTMPRYAHHIDVVKRNS